MTASRIRPSHPSRQGAQSGQRERDKRKFASPRRSSLNGPGERRASMRCCRFSTFPEGPPRLLGKERPRPAPSLRLQRNSASRLSRRGAHSRPPSVSSFGRVRRDHLFTSRHRRSGRTAKPESLKGFFGMPRPIVVLEASSHGITCPSSYGAGSLRSARPRSRARQCETSNLAINPHEDRLH